MNNSRPPILGRCILVVLLYGGMSLWPAFGQRYMAEAIPYRNAATIRAADGFIEVNFTRKEYTGKGDPRRVYYTYYRDSIFATQGGYHGHPLHGRYTERYPGKGLKVLGQYRYGLRVGKWQYWDDGGILRKVAHWRAGQETGRFSIYDDVGNVQQQGGWFVGMRNRIGKWFK